MGNDMPIQPTSNVGNGSSWDSSSSSDYSEAGNDPNGNLDASNTGFNQGGNQDLSGGDSLQNGNAYRDRQNDAVNAYNSIPQDYGITPQGENPEVTDGEINPSEQNCSEGETPNDVGAGKGNPTDGPGTAGGQLSEEEKIKMVAQLMGISEEEAANLLQGVVPQQSTASQDIGSNTAMPIGSQTTA
jgi:hypothetical protein